ncbi:MAG TPA: GNAT family N-acetyltransferase [Anaerolineae bacterium]
MAPNHQFPIQEYRRTGFVVSTDPNRLDVDVIHNFLANEAYWSPGIAREVVARAMEHSLCFGVYDGDGRQVGFARVITDFTTFAYLADVFMLRPYRGQGLGKWLVECMLAHPELQGLRKWTLNTQDAHGLYRRFGFQPNPHPENHLVYRPMRRGSL